MGSVIDELMKKTEALLFGRRTWQTMAAAWPGRAGDPFADRMTRSRICRDSNAQSGRPQVVELDPAAG